MKMNHNLYKLSKAACIAAVAIVLASCGGSGESKDTRPEATKKNAVQIDTDLKTRLAEFAQAPRAKGQFAFYVFDLTADRPVYGVNENLSLPSASCLKLLSGVAGLHLLGSNYHYETSLYTKGRASGGTLHGDATFKGSLDPQLQPQDLGRFARALRKRGIQKIEGRLIADLVITEPVKSEAHWYPWDLSFSRYGLFYKGAPRVMRELKYALRAQGIQVADSQLVMGRLPRGSRLIYKYVRPISMVTRRMWKNSSNTQATAMLYTIGHRVNRRGEPTACGVNYLRKFLRQDLGFTGKDLVIHDGCGLCTHNRLSPKVLTAVLRYGYHRKPVYRLLHDQLSLAGTDGTLARMMTSQATRGKIRAKTGTLSHPYGISSLAGYCEGSNGHLLAFAIMDSEMSVLDAHVYQRKLCEALVK
nr:D-alanyl-D-alanine carboxypeptidase [Prevotella sp. KH2C16]